MNIEYYNEYSPAMGKNMECKVYGHKGRPVLFIPCQDGRFFDFENFHMTDMWAKWIDAGEVMVFSIDTVKAGATKTATHTGEYAVMNSGLNLLQMNLHPLCSRWQTKETAGAENRE